MSVKVYFDAKKNQAIAILEPLNNAKKTPIFVYCYIRIRYFRAKVPILYCKTYPTPYFIVQLDSNHTSVWTVRVFFLAVSNTSPMNYDEDSRFCMNCPKTFDGNIPYFRLFLPFWGDVWA